MRSKLVLFLTALHLAAVVEGANYDNLGSGVCASNSGRAPYCQKHGLSHSACKAKCDSISGCTGYNPNSHGNWCFMFANKGHTGQLRSLSTNCHNKDRNGAITRQDGSEGGTCYRKKGPQIKGACEDKVQLYQHGDFNGASASFGKGQYNQGAMISKGINNDVVSSLKVPPGCKVTLYEHGGFSGYAVSFPAGEYRNGAMKAKGVKDNDVSSLKVLDDASTKPGSCKGKVQLYENGHFSGKSASFGFGQYNQGAMISKGINNDVVSSLRVPPGCKVTLYEHGGFSGYAVSFPAGEYRNGAMKAKGVKDNDVSSLKVLDDASTAGHSAVPTTVPTSVLTHAPTVESCKGKVHLYQHGDFNGASASFGKGEYNQGAMISKGMKNDDVSSLRVPPGCKVTVYEHGGFSGYGISFPAGEYRNGAMKAKGLKDNDVSSLKVLDDASTKPGVAKPGVCMGSSTCVPKTANLCKDLDELYVAAYKVQKHFQKVRAAVSNACEVNRKVIDTCHKGTVISLAVKAAALIAQASSKIPYIGVAVAPVVPPLSTASRLLKPVPKCKKVVKKLRLKPLHKACEAAIKPFMKATDIAMSMVLNKLEITTQLWCTCEADTTERSDEVDAACNEVKGPIKCVAPKPCPFIPTEAERVEEEKDEKAKSRRRRLASKRRRRRGSKRRRRRASAPRRRRSSKEKTTNVLGTGTNAKNIALVCPTHARPIIEKMSDKVDDHIAQLKVAVQTLEFELSRIDDFMVWFKKLNFLTLLHPPTLKIWPLFQPIEGFTLELEKLLNARITIKNPVCNWKKTTDGSTILQLSRAEFEKAAGMTPEEAMKPLTTEEFMNHPTVLHFKKTFEGATKPAAAKEEKGDEVSDGTNKLDSAFDRMNTALSNAQQNLTRAKKDIGRAAGRRLLNTNSARPATQKLLFGHRHSPHIHHRHHRHHWHVNPSKILNQAGNAVKGAGDQAGNAVKGAGDWLVKGVVKVSCQPVSFSVQEIISPNFVGVEWMMEQIKIAMKSLIAKVKIPHFQANWDQLVQLFHNLEADFKAFINPPDIHINWKGDFLNFNWNVLDVELLNLASFSLGIPRLGC